MRILLYALVLMAYPIMNPTPMKVTHNRPVKSNPGRSMPSREKSVVEARRYIDPEKRRWKIANPANPTPALTHCLPLGSNLGFDDMAL